MNNKLLISRSAILTYQTCNRKFYYQYAYNNHGVVGNKVDIDLLVGSCVHRGLQALLEHCRLEHPDGDFTDTCIDDAVSIALKLYSDTIETCEINVRNTEDVGFVLIEHSNLVEAMIRLYAINRLPKFLEEYEVLEVEKEDSLELSDNVLFLGKADGLLRRKYDNRLVVLSYKTASDFSPTIMRDIQHDMQGVSEIVIIKERLNKAFELMKKGDYQITDEDTAWELIQAQFKLTDSTFSYLKALFNKQELTPININLVQYEHLIKGKRRQEPYGSGIWKRQTPLLHPYKLESVYDLSAKMFNPAEYRLSLGQGRPPIGWEKIDIWKEMSIKQWVYLISKGQIQPELEIVKDLIISSDVVFRGNEEQNEWFLSVKAMTKLIASKLFIGADPNNRFPKDDRELHTHHPYLAIEFPKNTQQCHNYYGKDCMFVDVCHNGLGLDYSLENQIVQIRKPHHDLEMDLFKERGLIE